jgi:hypothetical protein
LQVGIPTCWLSRYSTLCDDTAFMAKFWRGASDAQLAA